MSAIHPTLEYAAKELVIWGLALTLARVPCTPRIFARLKRTLGRVASHPRRTMGGIFVAVLLLRLALLPFLPVPVPLIHDEYSYLLAADTFHSGRLTNPTPPVPEAFEAFHINVTPSYQSMYLPGVGMALAAGQFLGHPWIAVLLCNAFFCATLFWTVSGWLPRRYALSVALLAILACVNWNYWFDNYFCISLLGTGGALVLGAVPRIVRRPAWPYIAALGFGMVLLFLTRPFEGFLVVAPAMIVLCLRLGRRGWPSLFRALALPAGMLLLAGSWLLYYNWRGTGNPLLLPYTVNFHQYHVTGPFLFSPLRPAPQYHSSTLANVYLGHEMAWYQLCKEHTWGSVFRRKLDTYYRCFFYGEGILLLLGLLFLLRRSRGVRWALPLASLGFFAGICIMAWRPFPQYAAPAASLFLLFVAYGFYFLRRIRFRVFEGSRIASGLALALLLFQGDLFAGRMLKPWRTSALSFAAVEHRRVEEQLEQMPGKQLCLVRYSQTHNPLNEWVYNHADLESARVVWAHSLDAAHDQRLIASFPDRRIWVLDPDSPAPRPQPYPVLDETLAESLIPPPGPDDGKAAGVR